MGSKKGVADSEIVTEILAYTPEDFLEADDKASLEKARVLLRESEFHTNDHSGDAERRLELERTYSTILWAIPAEDADTVCI